MTDTAEPRTAAPHDRSSSADVSSRFWTGFGWGVVATIVMSLLMLIGMGTGVAPMPEPIPVAIVTTIFGAGLPTLLTIGLAIGSHLGYGGIWGGLLARASDNVTLWKGVGLGLFLWVLMQVIVLPAIGWGVFGTAVTPKIAGGTLVLHLVYGAVLGALLDR